MAKRAASFTVRVKMMIEFEARELQRYIRWASFSLRGMKR
jgi:hypothetical protein